MPQEAVLHRETYQKNQTGVDFYNDVMKNFYAENNMNVQGTWAKHCSDRILNRATNSQLQTFLAKQFGTK